MTIMLTAMINKLLSPRALTPEQKEKSMTKLQRARQSVLRLKHIKGFNPLKAGTLTFSSSDDNISELYERIDTYNNLVQSNSLTPQACFCKMREVNLDRFFTNDGVYVDQSALAALANLCEKLISSIEAGVAKENASSIYAERLLSKTFISIVEFERAVVKAA